MQLNHINLVVSNVADAVKLFETYFNFRCIDSKGDNIVAILKGANDFTLVIRTNKNDQIYPDAFHIGFMLDNEEEVRAIYNRLKNDGIAVGQEPRKIRDSSGFYFNFDKIMIEAGHYFN